ncbi:hypothetical protein F7725_004360 [Dissostichus mawsoni]|uniref:Uncharacterized protein n=1 Tax=Dissostichus mawsoni TaxID=36200 RepID=A0A7J5XIG8_DISMA|nr:hypothetical protein F7725_004360 [Dissostichus mawsoni]
MKYAASCADHQVSRESLSLHWGPLLVRWRVVTHCSEGDIVRGTMDTDKQTLSPRVTSAAECLFLQNFGKKDQE